jgi:hypothetical protein
MLQSVFGESLETGQEGGEPGWRRETEPVRANNAVDAKKPSQLERRSSTQDGNRRWNGV